MHIETEAFVHLVLTGKYIIYAEVTKENISANYLLTHRLFVFDFVCFQMKIEEFVSRRRSMCQMAKLFETFNTEQNTIERIHSF